MLDKLNQLYDKLNSEMEKMPGIGDQGSMGDLLNRIDAMMKNM